MTKVRQITIELSNRRLLLDRYEKYKPNNLKVARFNFVPSCIQKVREAAGKFVSM